MGVNQTHLARSAAIAREFGATRLILFGSAVESPETARDIDLACEGVEGWDLFKMGARLEETLGLNVDLVPLHVGDRFSEYVVQRGRVIYESSRSSR